MRRDDTQWPGGLLKAAGVALLSLGLTLTAAACTGTGFGGASGDYDPSSSDAAVGSADTLTGGAGADVGGSSGGAGGWSLGGAEDDAATSGSWDTSAGGGGWGGWDAGPISDADGAWGPDDDASGGAWGVTEPDREGCQANCDGLQCGPDGCGGSCGWCGGLDSCQAGACVDVDGCAPACAGRMVGVDDACGGVCSGSGMGIGLKPGGAQDAGYFRSQVLAGNVPSPETLPIEGWLNEHGTPLPPPHPDRFVSMHGFAGMFYDPARGEPTVALQLGLNSAVPPEVIEGARFNVCVVLDVSGSMEGDDKIGFAREGLLKMVDQLDEDDWFSLVTYDNTGHVLIPPQKVTNPVAMKAIISDIDTGGATNLYAGLELGYEQVLQHIADKDAIPRVMLVSDGDPTVGIVSESAIIAMSASYNNEDIGLTTIGVGDDIELSLMHGLALQGLGNFYFVDDADRLTEVFEAEVRYLMTPVADNLRIWFSLPDGFGVEDVYGFDFEEEDGIVQLLAPSPQFTITGEEDPGPGGNGGGGGGSDPEAPQVTVSTVFASKDNGLLMVKLSSPSPDVLATFANAALSTVSYAYDLVDDGATETFTVDVELGDLSWGDDGGFSFFSGAIMQRNFCVLRAGLSMKHAVTLVADQPTEGIQPAIQELSFARTLCNGIQTQLADPRLAEDVELIEQLMENICGEACLD